MGKCVGKEGNDTETWDTELQHLTVGMSYNLHLLPSILLLFCPEMMCKVDQCLPTWRMLLTGDDLIRNADKFLKWHPKYVLWHPDKKNKKILKLLSQLRQFDVGEWLGQANIKIHNWEFISTEEKNIRGRLQGSAATTSSNNSSRWPLAVC